MSRSMTVPGRVHDQRFRPLTRSKRDIGAAQRKWFPVSLTAAGDRGSTTHTVADGGLDRDEENQ
jgi:hypothetical protein